MKDFDVATSDLSTALLALLMVDKLLTHAAPNAGGVNTSDSLFGEAIRPLILYAANLIGFATDEDPGDNLSTKKLNKRARKLAAHVSSDTFTLDGELHSDVRRLVLRIDKMVPCRDRDSFLIPVV